MSLPKQKKISTAKAAKYLGISRWTLRRWGDKKLLPFIASKSGYRYYKQEDLDALKEHHAIVRVHQTKVIHRQEKGKAGIQQQRDETLLLPATPKPVPEIPPPPDIPPIIQKNAVGSDDLVIPPPPPPSQKKTSAFHRFWKILPFTVIGLAVLFILVPTRIRPHTTYRQAENFFGESVQTPSSILPLLSFRDVVLAAATDSSDLSGSSVQFFLSGTSEPAETILSPNTQTPQSGNTIYLSSMTDFASFQDSPFAYLSGLHGQAGPVAIIDNEELLRNHPFFANVHNGDKLLIYKESGKAILFRPYTNEIIAFAPLDAVPSTSYEQIEGSPVIALRNGMGTPYDMKTFEAELTYVAPKSVVVGNENAGKSDYKKSIIVDVVGNKKDEAQSLAYKLRLTVVPLPEGEYRAPAGVDFLIILGKDRVPFMNYIAPTSTASAKPQ